MGGCGVEHNCKVRGSHCPFCVKGSEYRPIEKGILFPAEAERIEARVAAKREHRASEAYRVGKKSNQKGKRREREVAKLLGGERVPLSGMLDGHPNDVILPNGWRAEVKARQNGLAVIYTGLEKVDVLQFREPNQPWLYGMTLPRFQLLLGSCLQAGSLGQLERKSGFALIRRWMAAENADLLLFKADRMEWLAVMDEAHFRVLSGEAVG